MHYGLKNPIRKQEFINRMNQQIKVYQHLIEGLNICEPFVESFNGKVPNVKLIKAIKTAENPHGLSFSLTNNNGHEGLAVSICNYKNRMYTSVDKRTMNYLSSYECCFLLPTMKPDEYSQGRIHTGEAIEQIDREREYLRSQIDECNNDILLYDEEIQAWEELIKQIETYEKKFSNRLRGYINIETR